MTLDRRQFIASAAAAGVIAPLVLELPHALGQASANPAGAERPRAGKAKNLVFMVADGMSFGTLALGDLLIQLRENRRANWVTLMGWDGARRALIDTRSADGYVTDSSAASTAWGIGELVNNGKVGLTPDGRMPTPILLHAKQAGKATGLVTSTRLSHATPAGFSVNVRTNRDDEGAIAEVMIARKYDLMLGGGAKFFDQTLLNTRPELKVVRSGKELAAWEAHSEVGTDPLLGLFTNSHMSFEIDRRTESLDEPSLAEMTRVALERLGRIGGSNGFVMQIEGGRVDHGGHYNDAAGLLYDMLAFDEAVGVAMRFVEKHPDTLLMVTADHATANPGLTEYGPHGIEQFKRALGFRQSFEWLEKKLAGKRTLDGGEPPEFSGAKVGKGRMSEFAADELASMLRGATGIDLEKGELDMLVRWRKGEVVDAFGLGNSRFGPLGAVLANHTAIAFLSPNHTADPVEFTSVGPGSEMLGQRMAINEIHRVMVKALDLPDAKPA